MIPVPDWLLVAVQWVHHMGAVAWVGGMIFFRLVLQPALRKAGIGGDPVRSIGHEFGSIVRIAIIILIVTGAFLAVVHLSAGENSRLYIGILSLKIALALYMFLVVWLRRRSAPSGNADGRDRFWPRFRRGITSTTALLILGVAVIGLADVLGAVGHGDGGHGHGSGGHMEVVEPNGHIDVPHDSVDHHGDDDGDDHHETEKSVDGDKGDVTGPPPTKEPQGGEVDHHGDDDGGGDDDDHHHGDDDGDDHHEAEKSVDGDKGDLTGPQATEEAENGVVDHRDDDDHHHGDDDGDDEKDDHDDGHDHDH